MKLLITGAAGYIGAHATQYFDKLGYDVIAIDNLERGNRKSIANHVKFYECDLRNSLIINIMKEEKPDAVLHLAAYANVGESFQFAHEYTMNNVGGTLNLMDAMVISNTSKIVFASSCSVYGEFTESVSEAATIKPMSPYAQTKVDCERIIRETYKAYKPNYAIMRLFNVAGADNAGVQIPRSESRIIPRAIASAQGRGVLTINGADFPTPDGTAIRDYVHVKDVVRAFEAALLHLDMGGCSTEFNIGSEVGSSVWDAVVTVERITGGAVRFKTAPRQPGDPAEIVSYCAKAKAGLTWEPKFSRLDEIVYDTWKAPVSI